MESISIRCNSCQHAMKFPAEKAGKKAKCPKCGTLTLIEVPASPVAAEAVVPAPSPSAEPAPAPKPVDEFADDGPASYGVFVDPELEERQRIMREEEAAKAKSKKKDKKKLPKVARKIKPIEDADSWQKVRLGLFCMVVGVCIWAFTHFLQGLYVLLGTVEISEYANLVADNIEHRLDEGLPDPPTRFWNMDELNLYLGMIVGRGFLGFAKVCLTLAVLLYFLQALAWAGGYFLCLPIPRRFGVFQQLLAMMAMLVFNGLVMLFFKLLPVLGAYNYIMIPFVVPEIAMTEYNMERTIPINLLYSGAPFWENFLTVIFKFIFYLEPTMAAIFVWSIGTAVKDDDLQDSGRGLTKLGLGSFFILLIFHLFSIAGASPVLVNLLRIIYLLWFLFLLLFMVQLVQLLLKCRAVLEEKIHPKNEAEEQ